MVVFYTLLVGEQGRKGFRRDTNDAMSPDKFVKQQQEPPWIQSATSARA